MEVLANVFDTIWWDDFLKKTDQMTIPAVFNNCMPAEETAQMRSYILDILGTLAKLRTNKFGYRVYIEGKQVDKDEMEEIYDHPPLPGELLEGWVERVFGERKFGMIINQGERFNMDLSRLIANKLSPYIDKTGVPTEGIIYTLFIGNYDSTPLGIHKDLPGKSVMHFHLGPGPKTMYTWPDEVFDGDVKKTYKTNPLDLYIPAANKHYFNEGDIYFMPENMYHIGTQEGLSIGIACWSYNRSNIDFAKRIFALMLENYLKTSNVMLKPDKNHIDDSSGLQKTLDLYEFPNDFRNLTFDDTLKEIYRELRYTLHSNAGYRTSPFPRHEQHDFSITDIVELEKPYRIMLHESKDGLNIYLYVRGVKIQLKNFKSIKTLIDKINEGNQQKVSELLCLLPSEWPAQHGLYIINLVFQHHGIKLVA